MDNRLTIISEPYYKLYGNKNRIFVRCKCSCGREKEIYLNSITRGSVNSCGCLRIEKAIKQGKNNKKHGLYYHPIHNVWSDMKTRCYNPKCDMYQYYGGKGIIVCNEWKNDFKKFYDWAIDKWQKGLVIDRIKNDQNYCPENCRFVTQKQSMNNMTTNHLVSAFGEIKTIAQWVEDYRCKVNYDALYYRIKSNWDSELAITKTIK